MFVVLVQITALCDTGSRSDHRSEPIGAPPTVGASH